MHAKLALAFAAALFAALAGFHAAPASAQQKMFSVHTQSALVAAHGVADVFADCPPGDIAFGGGMGAGNSTDIDMTSSAPTFDGATRSACRQAR